MSMKKMYSHAGEHRLTTTGIFGHANSIRSRQTTFTTNSRFYPQSSAVIKMKYGRRVPSEPGSSGPVSLNTSPRTSETEIQTSLLKGSRGATFSKIAKRNPEGWAKIVKAQLEHEKFLNSMRFYDRGILLSSRHPSIEGISYQDEQNGAKSSCRLKSFQIPWKNGANNSKFVSPSEQKEKAFDSLKNIATEPPQTPPEVKTSKTSDVGSSSSKTKKKEQNVNDTKIPKQVSEVKSKPYASLVEKFRPLGTKSLAIQKTGSEKVKMPKLKATVGSLSVKLPLPLEKFHTHMQASGFLSKAKRPEPEPPTSLSLSPSESVKSHFSLNSPKSMFSLGSSLPHYSDPPESQSSNSEKSSAMSHKSQFSANSQKSAISLEVSANSEKSSTDSRDSYFLTNKLRIVSENARLLEKVQSNVFLQHIPVRGAVSEEKFQDSDSEISNVTTKQVKPRIFPANPLLPVFILQSNG